VADRVVRLSKLPVLLIRPQEDGRIGSKTILRVLLPLDGSVLAEQAIPFAISIGRRLNAPLTVIRDVPISWLTGADPSGMSSVSPDIVQTIEDDAQDYLRETVARLRSEGLVVSSRFGPCVSPAVDIVGMAHQTAGALIVMTTHGRSGVQRALLGSVTDRVIRGSYAPVLVIPASPDATEDA
jgi:nucleotide-binding universal stress UspA family protein